MADKIDRFRRESLCDCIYRLFQMGLFGTILVLDRLEVGRVSNNIDFWVEINLLLLFIEFVYRSYLAVNVTWSNFTLHYRVDLGFKILVHGFTVWGIFLIYVESEQFDTDTNKYFDPGRMRTVIVFMIGLRTMSLCCCGYMCIILSIILCYSTFFGVIDD